MADNQNHLIRKISPAGVVSTLAGLAGYSGYSDGTSTSATFNGPNGVAIDKSGNVYVADYNNNLIRKISPAGVVSTLAGLATVPGNADGTSGTASFYYPSGVAVDNSGYVYVADKDNHLIRKISPAGVVSTLAGSGGTFGTLIAIDGTGTTAKFYFPYGVSLDTNGNVYVADGNHRIRKITPANVVSTLAGTGSTGAVNGTGQTATFYVPRGVTVDTNGNVYVADYANHLIRKISPAGVVSTVAGGWQLGGYVDGTGTAARFNSPNGVAVDTNGYVYVADYNNNSVRKITPIF